MFHGFLGEAQKELGIALTLSHQIEEEYWPDFCRLIDWFGYFRLQPGERLFEPDPVFPTSGVFRAGLAAFTKLYADRYAADNIRMNKNSSMKTVPVLIPTK